MLKLLFVTILFVLTYSTASATDAIQVGIYKGGFPPYYFDRVEKGGIYVDILRMIEKRTKLKFDINLRPMTRIEKEFSSGTKTHMETGIAKMWRPKLKGKGHLWSAPFINYSEGIFVRKSFLKKHHITKDTLRQASDMKKLKDNRVGWVMGYNFPFGWTDDKFIDSKTSKNETNVIKMFKAKRFSMYYMGKDTGKYLAKKMGLTGDNEVVYLKDMSSLPLHFLMHKGKKAEFEIFNAALKKMIKNKEIEKLSQKYF